MLIVLLYFLFGAFNCISEIILRISAIEWRYELYCLVPIRGHALLALASFCIIILMFMYRSEKMWARSVAGTVNLLYIVLWIDTLLLA